MQFVVFLASYITRLVYYSAGLAVTDEYTGAVLLNLLPIIVDILPITVVLLAHHRSYGQQSSFA